MAGNSDNPWKKIKSEVVYKNKWYSVRRDEVITPSGEPGEYSVIVETDAVFIVAMDDDKNIHLVGLYRYPTDVYSIEVPAGNTDGEEPLVAARRELQEETGLAAEQWTHLGKFQSDNGKTTSFGHVFLARGLRDTKTHDQEAEGIKEVQKVPLAQALGMIRNGVITDAQSIAAITHVALYMQTL
jgi:8-oxo-dGTP pyrophosphatase MutT (NUDIX family)